MLAHPGEVGGRKLYADGACMPPPLLYKGRYQQLNLRSAGEGRVVPKLVVNEQSPL